MPRPVVTLDIETQSEADLGKVGQHAYSEHPSTKLICMSFGVDYDPIQSWWPELNDSYECPPDLLHAINEGAIIEAHNVPFEFSHWMSIFAPVWGWPMLGDFSRWRDTMATAAYYAMPQGLDKLCRALKMEGKDRAGEQLITKYCKLYLKSAQRRIPDGSEEDWVTWSKMTKSEQERHPEAKAEGGFFRDDFSRFVDYCERDVLLEQSVSEELGDLPDFEQEIWQREMEMNYRGLHLDAYGIHRATTLVDERADELEEEFKDMTGLTPRQHPKVLQWFHGQGIELENLQKDHLEEVMEEWELPQGDARRALEIRLAINKASTKKLDAMQRQISRDGRARFQVRYHGTVTGRPTGTGFQPLNLVRSYEDVDPDRLVKDICDHHDLRYLDMIYGDAMFAISKAGRHWIKAKEGNQIIAGDYSNIEAIILAQLAGEQWKIDAFHKGEPIYELMGCKIHKLPQSAIDLARSNKKAFKNQYPFERQDGKVGELAFGYQGALGAWLQFDKSGRHSDDTIIGFCRGWRDEHPMIKASWYGSQDAMMEAVEHPGRVTGFRDLGFEIVDEWLTMILPDSKRLWYRDPKIRWVWPKEHNKENEECADGACDHKKRPQVSYKAMKLGNWRTVYTYGGKIMENATQATARQIMVRAHKAAEKYKYRPILTVYDELVTENRKGFGSEKELEEIMVEAVPEFARGWPIRAEAWAGDRYRKG